MAGQRVNPLLAWFNEESAGAPPALRARAASYLERGTVSGDPAADLAAAAGAALSATLAHPGGRDVALDLLAADALVTLALKAQAERNPAGLGRFASALRTGGPDLR
ncbi:MAG TPA: hypothetical protein VLB00_07155 [Gemmatimonadales bacterium]|nr:hypothetical protein [Gemmatimonadales bacterium]